MEPDADQLADQIADQIADRRTDSDLQDRLRQRMTEDGPLLDRLVDRLASMKSVSPEQLAEALRQAGPSFTLVRVMPGGRVEILTDRVTADGEPITIYASTAVTGEWHVDDGAETYHRLVKAGFDINVPGGLDLFHNLLYRYRLHRVGSTVFARAPEDEPLQLLCRRFADALVALDGQRPMAEPAAQSADEIRAGERMRLLQLVQGLSPGEMDGWAFRDEVLALLRS